MAIIYTYPLTELLATDDTIVITDSSSPNKATRSATIGQINALGPQGTVTDVTITMPVGFEVEKTPDPFTSGEIKFNIALTSGLALPADDPANSVQFNKNGILTGEPGFTFEENVALGENKLSLGEPILAGNTRGIINLYNRGRIALWATTAGGSNQAVALTGPRDIATSPGSYEISLPTDDPTLDHTPNPTLPVVPRVWVIDGTDLGGKSFDSKFLAPSDLGISAVGEAFELQFRKNGSPGIFDASQQLKIVPLAGQSAITQGLTLSVGSMSRTQIVAPQRGDVRIGSGPIDQNGANDYGASLNLEYVYPGAGPVDASPGQNPPASYSHVALRGPKYDNTIGTGPNEGPNGENMSITYQDYSLILPQLNPEKSDDLQPYASSKLLIVNSVDATNNNQRYFETKFIDPDNLGISAAGQNLNVQFNNNGVFDGDSSFLFKPDNQTAGVPQEAPRAHELILGAGGGALPGMLTLFGDNDPVSDGGVGGILRFMAPTGQDFATITGPDNQTQITLEEAGSSYTATDAMLETSGGTGTGLMVYVVVNQQGEVTNVSLAMQGSGYTNGDILTILDGDNNAEIKVKEARAGADEEQIYDIKLPKYAPFNDKIWFGKGTGKNGELTTNDYFKITLEQDPGHSPGGRLQLGIGSPSQVANEPYGSILLNGGNNNDEGGVIRLSSAINNVVGIAGPQPRGGTTTVSYDFSLPDKSPEETNSAFVNGVDTVNIDDDGSGYTTGGRFSVSGGTGNGCSVNITAVNGAVTAVDIIQTGEGYTVGDLLTIIGTGNEDAVLEVTAVNGFKNKVLVATTDKAFGPAADSLYETRWIDPNDLGTTTPPTGFAPLPIYQGDQELTSTGGATVTWIMQTVCDNGVKPLTKAKYFSSATSGSSAGNSVKIRCAVYEGEINLPNGTSLVAYGEYDTFPSGGALQEIEEGVNVIDITDGGNITWTPTAGIPIIVIWEIVNGANDMALLGSNFTSGLGGLISEGSISRIIDNSPLFETKPQPGSQISSEVAQAEEGTQRPCTHFVP